jgi:hypothetical protein
LARRGIIVDKVASVPDGEVIVSLGRHNNEVIVSTDKNTYLVGSDNVMRKVTIGE